MLFLRSSRIFTKKRIRNIEFQGKYKVVSCFILVFVISLAVSSCESMGPTGARIFRYHRQELLKSAEELTVRLYAKNPKYELDRVRRQKKIELIFHGKVIDKYRAMPSNEVLAEAFAAQPGDSDRVYLLGLGMAKSIREAYTVKGGIFLINGLQISEEHLQRLYRNLSQVNWRLKTYRDAEDKLLFLTNEIGPNDYLNMGYEVLMTEILTRVKDDIYIRGGLPSKYMFNASTLFISILF